MRTLATIPECRAYIRSQRQAGHTIGFVPTMGALHEGHLSLMRRSCQDNDITVISVFVNPTQFGPDEDYGQYPRDLARDAELAAGVGVDAVFAPAPEEMYPAGAVTYVDQTGETIAVLEGKHRPGHFRGVLTVVAKLLGIVQPDRASFGHKDYQQAALVKQMVRDLAIPVEIVVSPTIREPDGLAMSSRNQYLDPAARRQAPCIHRALQAAQAHLAAGETRADALADTIDYVAIAHPETLAPVETIAQPAVALVAVHIAGTRLIDNCPLNPQT